MTTHADPTHAPATLPFTQAEWAELRRDDWKAAAAIVGLMVGIFLTGVVLYSIVCLIVA